MYHPIVNFCSCFESWLDFGFKYVFWCQYVTEERDGTAVRRRGRPRKRQNIEGKRLFDEHSSSEEEDSISGSDHDDAQEEEKQDEEEEEEAPLIHSLRSSKLRSLKVSKDAKAGVSASKTSGIIIPVPCIAWFSFLFWGQGVNRM